MDINQKFFFDSLMRYIENPCFATKMDLAHKQMAMQCFSHQEEQEKENRIAEKVLEQISVRLDNNGILQEIKSLRDELQKLYGMFA